MIPSSLEGILSSWPFDTKPLRVLYIIPTGTNEQYLQMLISKGQNPSGFSLPLDRKQQIYRICSKYNILILGTVNFCTCLMTPYAEDDPYYHLQLPSTVGAEEFTPVVKSPTFLSMDTDGRVLRFTLFSLTLHQLIIIKDSNLSAK